MRHDELMGLVLAGGKSSRMGCDKALLKLDGETLLNRAMRVLAQLVPISMVSCAKGRPYAGFPCIEDTGGLEGPARGISAGLAKAASMGLKGIIALACDLPAIRAPALARLARAHSLAPPGTMATLYQDENGKVEMLAGVYSTTFMPALAAGMALGERSLFWLLPEARRQIIIYGPDLAPQFANCNTLQDLAAIRQTQS